MSRGERIRRYRKLKGWNQTTLGEKVGVGQTAIRNYERDLRAPTPDMLQALADALEVPVTSLRTTSSNPPERRLRLSSA